jgi:hypothetical protein
MKKKLSGYILTWVDVEILGGQKMLKVVSLSLEILPDMMLQVTTAGAVAALRVVTNSGHAAVPQNCTGSCSNRIRTIKILMSCAMAIFILAGYRSAESQTPVIRSVNCNGSHELFMHSFIENC